MFGSFMRKAIRCGRPPSLSGLCVVASFLSLVGCGGSGSSGVQPPPPPPPPVVTSVTVSPGTAQVAASSTLSFTAQVAGTGAFSSSVTWAVNGVNGGNSTVGTIVNGQYGAPATPPNPANVTITATSVEDPTKLGSSTATIIPAIVLTSISPGSASAGETITVAATYNINPIETPQMIFSGTNGTSVSMTVNPATGDTVTVPFGAISGPIYLSLPPQPGSGAPVLTSNSVSFTRLPNLLVHAANKDLSSGETLQLDWRVAGGPPFREGVQTLVPGAPSFAFLAKGREPRIHALCVRARRCGAGC